ncbi:MAG: hypothetical protein ACXVJD_03445, partial [Mucilaginibacter sp.]
IIILYNKLNFFLSHISPYDLASLGTLFTGLTVALLLAFAKGPGQAANLFLSSAIFAGTLTPARGATRNCACRCFSWYKDRWTGFEPGQLCM